MTYSLYGHIADYSHQRRHQLGLHVAANARHLPPRERVIRQRVYIALRVFDAYVTSSLGLPRNLRAIEPAVNEANLSSIDNDEFLAADANIDLLEILGTALEKAYFTDAVKKGDGPTTVQYKQLRKVGKALERWEQ